MHIMFQKYLLQRISICADDVKRCRSIIKKLQMLTFNKSCVLTRVAKSDWWASLNVVSVNNVVFSALTALAKASGPSLTNISRKFPFGGSAVNTKKSYTCAPKRACH